MHMSVRVPKSKSDFIAQNQDQFAEAVKLTSERSVVLRANNSSIATNKPTSTGSTIPSNQNKVIYVVKSGDVLGSIAQKHGTTVTNLKAWNNLSSNTIKIGQKLDIYTKSSAFEKTIAQADNRNVVAGDNPKTYTVQPGDSLWLISKKLNGVTVDQIKKLNNLNTNQIKPGQKLIIG
jgi:membrane-bound lytic murein transglycosylase D